MVILGSYFDILGILVEKMRSVGFSLAFEYLFCWGILLSRVSFLFAGTKPKNQQTTTTRSLVDGGAGIWGFQHCIVITRGPEGRTPKTASVVGTSFGVRSIFLSPYMFFDIFYVFLCFSQIFILLL